MPIGDINPSLTVAPTALSGGNPIREGNVVFNITPSSLSLGHVVSQLSGPPENGGSGVMPISFDFQNPTTGERVSTGIPAASIGGMSMTTLALIAGAAVVGIVLLRRQRL